MPFEIVRNDIVKMRVDALVNTANPRPIVGSGVDGAIHLAAGPELLRAREAIGSIAVGNAVLTPGYDLAAKYVIHAVGPAWRGGNADEEALLASCYRKALRLAAEANCESIAFPLISSGNYGFPKELALNIAQREISDFLQEGDMQIYLVIFGKEELALSEKLCGGVTSYIDENYIRQKTEEEYVSFWQRWKRKRPGDSLRTSSKRLEDTERARKERYSETLLADSGPALYPDEQIRYCLNVDAASASKELASDKKLAAQKALDGKPAAQAEEKSLGAASMLCGSAAKTEETVLYSLKSAAPAPRPKSEEEAEEELENLLKNLDAGFAQTLLMLIDRSGKTDAEIYKKANLDRKLFSKIRSNPNYKPSKNTALALAVALQLNLEETLELIGRAGFTLSHSSKADLIVEYFIQNHMYNVIDLNMVLFKFDQPLLGGKDPG